MPATMVHGTAERAKGGLGGHDVCLGPLAHGVAPFPRFSSEGGTLHVAEGLQHTSVM